MERIDVYLSENGFTKSRPRAVELIKKGAVLINGIPAKKPGIKVKDGDNVTLLEEDIKYVSRGALKLKEILDATGEKFNNKVVLDVGSSTGGFSEVAIEYGAKLVYAVDVGRDQFDKELRKNKNIKVFEGTDARDIEADDFNEEIDIVVSDVSFISITKILPELLQKLSTVNKIFVLIKPQFELQPEHIAKGGIVKNEKFKQMAIDNVKLCVKECGFEIQKVINSPIKGGSGNQEYLLFAERV